MPDGREILVCETEDGGMGYTDHYIYSVDLTHPVDVRDTTLVAAVSYDGGCTIHRQEVRHVEWDEAARRLSVILRTPVWRHTCDDSIRWPKRPPQNATLEFDLTENGFKASETATE
jgi:hypothetical protein